MQENAHGHPGGPAPDQEGDANSRILSLTAILLVLTFFFASFYPKPLILVVLSTLLMLAALASAVTAAVLSQRIFGEKLNLWDKAILLVFAGMVAGALVDQEAVTAFIEGQTSSTAGEPAASPALDGD